MGCIRGLKAISPFSQSFMEGVGALVLGVTLFATTAPDVCFKISEAVGDAELVI